jgi:hypothetical protein
LRLTVEDQIAEGDKVVNRWRGEMTHSGEMAGAAPTGQRITFTGINIDRFEAGATVTLAVPEPERRRLSLVYDFGPGRAAIFGSPTAVGRCASAPVRGRGDTRGARPSSTAASSFEARIAPRLRSGPRGRTNPIRRCPP